MRALLPLVLLAACAARSPRAPSDSDHTGDTDALADTDREPLPACPSFADGVDVGTLASPDLDELSGLVASRAMPGVWWANNDSGDSARAFALGDDGADLGTFDLPDVPYALDWEDIAIAPAGAGWSLLLGDIGDNLGLRGNITVWRIPEPDASAPGRTATPERLDWTYPDGPHNAETLLLDPTTGDAFLVTKSDEGSRVYRAPAPLVSGTTLEDVGVLLPFGSDPLPGGPLATGGDISADGARIAIRTYTSAFVWRRTPDRSVAEALAGPPCVLPTADESQGESIAWEPDGRAYRTISEGTHTTVFRFAER